jgi:anaerobic magnesium-protoporphyrin IX monomethyl ester cyclase
MNPALSERDTVLLAHSYYLRYDPKQTEKMKPYAPLATLLVASLLRQGGYQVRLFDAMLADGVEEFHRVLERDRPGVVGIVEDNFNFLTKMCTTRMREAALDMIRRAKGQGCLVAVNGADAVDQPALYLGAGADAVILGEPEHAMRELLSLWQQDQDALPAKVAGLVIRDPASNGGPPRLHRTSQRPTLTDLDALPFPTWDLVDVERYRAAWTGAHGRLSWSMATSRGCPYRCNWCAKPIFGTRYTQRSPGNVAEELRQLGDAVSPDHVWFADDIFGLTPKWIEAFAREVTARGARTAFTVQSRVNLMKPRVVAALAQAGAEEVWLGVESGAQHILDAMDKGTTLEDVREASRNLRAHGIRACWFIQLGYLGEEWDDIVHTRDLIRAEQPDDIGVSVSYPLPGTTFYETVRSQLHGKTNWSHSDDLDMMFGGTYRTEFYRSVRDLLHEEVRRPNRRTGTEQAALDARWEELRRDEQGARRSNGGSLPTR